ncbi:MAG: ABC transporter permease [Kiloniellaceae bacterium]
MTETVVIGGIADVDKVALKRQLQRTERARKLVAIGLIAPLLLFIFINFVVPVGVILFKSIDDREVSTILPRATEALSQWEGEGLPGDDAFKALFIDMREAQKARSLVKAGKRLNSAKSGFNALIGKTGRRLPKSDPESYKDALIKLDKRWGDRAYWIVLKRTANPVTPIYLLSAFDLTMDQQGDVVRVPKYQRIFNKTWVRTFWMSLVITMICTVLGYPLAYVMANLPTRVSNILMILVLIPFWTSLLVRTTAWLVLLQNQGVVNDFGIFLTLWSERLQLIHNRFGVFITMSHILLPYMVLPLFAIMKRIPASYVRAAKSLGANPLVAFLKVYLPLTIHGVGAGALFVFILSIGFYITPALVGGRNDQMISYFIAFYTNEVLNWGAAAALSAVLLVLTGAVFYAFKTTFGLDKMQIR